MAWRRCLSNHIRDSYMEVNSQLPNLKVTSDRVRRSGRFDYPPDVDSVFIESKPICPKCGGSGMVKEMTFEYICCKHIRVTNQEECMECDNGEFGIFKNYVTCDMCSIDSFPP